MKQISEAMRAHLASTPTTLTTMWKITRLDGVIMTFTEHDKDITYGFHPLTDQPLVYRSAGGFNRSAIKSSGTFATDNMEVSGFLDEDTITETELRNGAFDYAEVEIFMVNYEDLTMGDVKLRFGYFGEVRNAPSGAFLVELRGLVDLLAQKVGEVYTPECRADLGDSRCKVQMTPPEWRYSTRYNVGDRVIFPVDGAKRPEVRIGPSNGDFEEGNLAGWAGTLSSTVISGTFSSNALVPGQSLYLRTVDTTGGLRTTMNLANGGWINNALISTGKLMMRIGFWALANEDGSSIGVSCEWKTGINGTGTTISTTVRDFGYLFPIRHWRYHETVISVPATARSFIFRPIITAQTEFSLMDVGWDVFDIRLIYPEEEVYDYSIYGGVEFECISAITVQKSGVNAPDWDTTIGGETADGQLVWRCVRPQHTFIATVEADATSSSVVTIGDLDRPGGWFNWGIATFLTGANAGKSIEVKSYNTSTGAVTFHMPLAYQSLVGDKLIMRTGCARTRATCNAKFGNILNFRGEPDLPGNGEYFRVAGKG